MKTRSIVLLVALVGVVVLTVNYFVSDSQQFDAWTKQRDDWKARCSQYVDQPVTSAAARECQQDLQVLTAEARRHGWIK